jgi:hypothetical protein
VHRAGGRTRGTEAIRPGSECSPATELEWLPLLRTSQRGVARPPVAEHFRGGDVRRRAERALFGAWHHWHHGTTCALQPRLVAGKGGPSPGTSRSRQMGAEAPSIPKAGGSRPIPSTASGLGEGARGLDACGWRRVLLSAAVVTIGAHQSATFASSRLLPHLAASAGARASGIKACSRPGTGHRSGAMVPLVPGTTPKRR